MKVNHLLPTIFLLAITSCNTVAREPINAVTVIPTSIIQTVSPISTSTNPSQEPSLVFFTSELGKFQVWLPASENIENSPSQKRSLANQSNVKGYFLDLTAHSQASNIVISYLRPS